MYFDGSSPSFGASQVQFSKKTPTSFPNSYFLFPCAAVLLLAKVITYYGDVMHTTLSCRNIFLLFWSYFSVPCNAIIVNTIIFLQCTADGQDQKNWRAVAVSLCSAAETVSVSEDIFIAHLKFTCIFCIMHELSSN